MQVHSRGDARLVQHHSSLQEESFYDDCHRVGPGLCCVLSPAVWIQHHRSDEQYFIFMQHAGCRMECEALSLLDSGRECALSFNK